MKLGLPAFGVLVLGGAVMQDAPPYDLSETFSTMGGVIEAAGDAGAQITEGITEGVPWTQPMLYFVLLIVALRSAAPLIDKWLGNRHAREAHHRDQVAAEAQHRRDLERREHDFKLRDGGGEER